MPETKNNSAEIDKSAGELQPITQDSLVSQMDDKVVSEEPAQATSTNPQDSSVVQFASPSAVASVNELIDDHDEPDRKMSKWVVIIVVLVLLILALGAGVVYYFTQFSAPKQELVSPIPDESQVMPTPVTAEDETLNQLESVNDSDDMEAINEDVDKTNLDSMGEEMDEIEGSL